jgi:hypothetical protein
MGASRPRRVFASSVVVTLAACSGSPKETGGTKPASAFVQRWSVMKNVDDCRAYDTISDCPAGAMCNPPPPRAIACPAGVKEDAGMQVAERADHSCVIVPPMCDELACATVVTPCPMPHGVELPTLRWEVARDDGGACLATWRVQGVASSVSVPCPFPDPKSGAAQSVITRADENAPCFADAREQTKIPVPCPAAAKP